MCQCPLGLIPHFYLVISSTSFPPFIRVSMPSRAYTSFLHIAPSYMEQYIIVSMPSRAYTSFLPGTRAKNFSKLFKLCQCPLGLIPHFYSRKFQEDGGQCRLCQCPLGLIPHFYRSYYVKEVSEHHRCQCPLGLIPHFYGTPSKT